MLKTENVFLIKNCLKAKLLSLNSFCQYPAYNNTDLVYILSSSKRVERYIEFECYIIITSHMDELTFSNNSALLSLKASARIKSIP